MMSSAARQDRADRFIRAFNTDATKALKLTGKIKLLSQGLCFEPGWGEVRHFIHLLIDDQEIEADTGLFNFDCEGENPEDTVRTLMGLLGIGRAEVIKRLVKANVFPAKAFSDEEEEAA